MIHKGMTVSEAAHRWVSEFSRFPHSMITALIKMDIDSWHEITLPTVGDRVDMYGEGRGTITKVIEGSVTEYTIELDDGEEITTVASEFDVEKDSFLPCYGTMWQFGDSADDFMLEKLDGLRAMSDCGFRIYENDEWGYFFGIDGAGYSFYEEHWIPLYKSFGLQWHDPVAEQEYQMLRKGYKKGRLGLKEYWFDGDNIVTEVIKHE